MNDLNVSSHICKLIDICEDPNYIYVISEFCGGGTLHDFGKKKKI